MKKIDQKDGKITIDDEAIDSDAVIDINVTMEVKSENGISIERIHRNILTYVFRSSDNDYITDLCKTLESKVVEYRDAITKGDRLFGTTTTIREVIIRAKRLDKDTKEFIFLEQALEDFKDLINYFKN